MAVTREEFDEWKQLPVTKRLMQQISLDLDNMKIMLIDIGPEDLHELQGRCKASLNFLNIEYEDLYE